jgi:hypothetical protein
VTAYTGAAQYISSKKYLTVAASVLATEARHASWVAGNSFRLEFFIIVYLQYVTTGAVNKVNPWSGALDVPLSPNDVFSLAAPFIKSCPSSNPPLPFKAFPTLEFPTGSKPGQKVTLKFDKGSSTSDLFIAFFTGLSQEFAPIANDNSVTIPKDLIGTVYAVVSSNATMATDDSTVAGPAILTFNFDTQGMVIQ